MKRMKLALLCMVFCGCSIDSAFDTVRGALVWGMAFLVMVLCVTVKGKES